MKITKPFVVMLLLFFSVAVNAQNEVANNTDEIRIRKYNLVLDFERQIKDIPFAAVRVQGKYQIASWLWKNGKDSTGLAEEIAVNAIDDHYKNKAEIPFGYSADSKLFILLDEHAKEAATRLRAKYKTSLEDRARSIPNLLDQRDGDKLATDAAISLLSRPGESVPDLTYLLLTLEQRGSPHLNTLLGAILTADEVGRTEFSTRMIEVLTGFFVKPSVPDNLKMRFVRLVAGRSQNVAALSELDQMAYYRTLQRLWPDITARFPEMLAEVGTSFAILSARVASSIREANERYERIQKSTDKLAATVAEAERADDDTTKYILYRSAARLALEGKQFVYAIDLMVKASEIDMSANPLPEDSRKREHDQFYRQVVERSLSANEAKVADRAVRSMSNPLSKAESLISISSHHLDKNDLNSGRSAHDEAVKFATASADPPEAITTLIKMLLNAHKIDSDRVSELGRFIPKMINALPSLDPEDKPDTDNYRNYVTKVMVINWNLLPALDHLVKVDRNGASDLVSRIEKKEIKIIAEFVLLTESINSLPEQLEANRSTYLSFH